MLISLQTRDSKKYSFQNNKFIFLRTLEVSVWESLRIHHACHLFHHFVIMGCQGCWKSHVCPSIEINKIQPSWWLQPIWKICSSNWIISPIFGVKITTIWVATTYPPKKNPQTYGLLLACCLQDDFGQKHMPCRQLHKPWNLTNP